MKFTGEQQAAIDLAVKGENFSLVAPAGSGKSATALGMAEAIHGKKILYLCYNTAARREAERKFKHLSEWVDVRTTSQIGFRAFVDKKVHGVESADKYYQRMQIDAKRLPASEIAKMLKLKTIDFGNGVVLDGYNQAWFVLDTIDKFCNSNAKLITSKNVHISIEAANEVSLSAARSYIAKIADRVWHDAMMPDSNLPFTMNNAFKLVSQGGRSFGYEVVLLDEAQDSNDNTVQFVKNQNAQSIMVGDPAQALYQWRGASDQILRHEGPRLFLTQSFRFGEAVAEEATRHLVHTGTGVTIRGLSSIGDRVTEGGMANPDVVLTRTNAGSMEHALRHLASGKKVSLVRGTKQIVNLAKAAGQLMAGKKPASLELSAFEDWGQLVAYTAEPGGGHLKSIVNLINAHGVGGLIDACEQMTEYSSRFPKHDVAVTTCHSIKGLEWPNVQIGDDFFEPTPYENPVTKELEQGSIEKSEAMIHYVAVTRAQRHLDRSGLSWVDKYSDPVEQTV